MFFDLKNYEGSLKAELQTQADIMGTAAAPALVFEDAKVAHENLSLLKASPTIAAAIYTTKGTLFATFMREANTPPGFPPLPRAEGVTFDGGYVNAWRRIVSNDEVLGTVST